MCFLKISTTKINVITKPFVDILMFNVDFLIKSTGSCFNVQSCNILIHFYLCKQMEQISGTVWIISVLAAIMIGMSKTGLSGLGTLVVPVMAYAFGAMPSSGVVLPMLVMADIFGVIYYHRSTHRKTLILILPWAMLGLVAGIIVGKHISATGFKHLMAAMVLISIFIMLWQEFSKDKSATGTVKNKSVAAVFGIAGGFSTMIGNAAGPVMSVYLLSRKLPKNEYIGTAAWFFFVVNLTKLPLQIWVWHNITLTSFLFNLTLLPAIAAGAFLGIRIVRVIPEKPYRWFVIIATITASVALLL